MLPKWKLWAALAALAVLLPCAGASAQEWPDLSDLPEEQGGGEQDAALIIGMEDYVFAPDIPGALQNANDWYLYLTRTRSVPVGSVFLLRDQEGTREAMLEKAQEAAASVGEGGTLWFIFVGHGAPGKDGKDGILVGSDAQQSANSLYARSVSQRELLKVLKSGQQSQTVAVIDACFSGKGNGGDALVAGLQPLLPVTEPITEATVLSAGASDQFAGPLPGGNRPAFSYLTLGALRGWGDQNKDTKVTAREAVDYSRDVLRVLLRDRRQEPMINGPSQEVSMSLGATEEGPDIGELVVALNQPKITGPKGQDVGVSTKGGSLGRPLPFAGFARVGFGVHALDGGAMEVTTFDTSVNAPNNGSIFDSFDLTLSDIQGGATPLGVSLQFNAGQEGFYLGGDLNLLWANDIKVSATVTAPDDGFSEGVPTLVAGLDATITDYLRAGLGGTAGYRLSMDALSLYAQVGAGLGIGLIDFEFVIDGQLNEVSATQFGFLLPLQTGVDFDVTRNVFVHLDYSFYVLPSSSHATHAGIGVYY
jgi:opacity protein-like surface antigen